MNVSSAPDIALLTFAAAKPTETWPTRRPFSHSGALPAATQPSVPRWTPR